MRLDELEWKPHVYQHLYTEAHISKHTIYKRIGAERYWIYETKQGYLAEDVGALMAQCVLHEITKPKDTPGGNDAA